MIMITVLGVHRVELCVHKARNTQADRQIVIAVVDGQFCIKQLCRLPDGVLLRSHGAGHGDILVGPEQELSVWGVVCWAIHKV